VNTELVSHAPDLHRRRQRERDTPPHSATAVTRPPIPPALPDHPPTSIRSRSSRPLTGNELEGDLLHDQTCSASICRIPSVCEADAHDSKSSCSSNIVGVMGVDMDNNMMTRVGTWLNLVFLVLDLLLVTM
ncbi:hypothetical protein EJB05_27903, partial [Eragrostis curvula]